MIDLNGLKKTTLEIGRKRIANGANLDGDFLKHCGGELVEAVVARELYESHKDELCSKGNKLNYSHELADIIICVLNEAETADIDIEKAILEVVEKNRLRAEGKGDKK